MTRETDYAYAVARLRALEKNMLSKAVLLKMADAKDAGAAVKILIESGFGYPGSEHAGAFLYEQILREEEIKLYELLYEICPDDKIINLFSYRNDAHNLKVLLKGEMSGSGNNDILSACGTVLPQNIASMAKERKFKGLPKILTNAYFEAVDAFNRIKTPFVISNIIDRAYFMLIDEKVSSMNNEFIKGLFTAYADIANIGLFARIKKEMGKLNVLNDALVKGGIYKPVFYAERFNEPFEVFINTLLFSPYGKIVENGITAYVNNEGLSIYEIQSDNHIINYIKGARRYSLGIEPVAAYIAAKLNDIKNARIIMVGKTNKLDNEYIIGRLRDTYV